MKTYKFIKNPENVKQKGIMPTGNDCIKARMDSHDVVLDRIIKGEDVFCPTCKHKIKIRVFMKTRSSRLLTSCICHEGKDFGTWKAFRLINDKIYVDFFYMDKSPQNKKVDRFNTHENPELLGANK
ncbi:hypothetical protein KAR91_25985 [Candidatus Pacearchaeota archaeon]|nr:hypothetical protein [Candidatus Pacearchaeota archaeon]